MKKFIINSICLILIFNFLFCSIDVHATTQTTLTEQQQAIINIANSYYYQASGIQYDQQRRFTNVKPEQAKTKWPIYLDCSSFVYNVYLQAFGVKLQKLDSRTTYLTTTQKQILEAQAEYSNKNVIKTSGTENYYVPCYVDNIQKIKNNGTLKNLKKLLQPGDLIVYRRSTAGHVVLYLGDEQIIHCIGQKYDYSECVDYTETAAIQKTTLDALLSKSGSMYLLKSNVTSFAVIRPLKATYLKNATLTDYAKLKNELAKLDVYTLSSPGNLRTVNLGSTITYSLYLNNKDTDITLENILVKEEISDYLTVDKNSIVTSIIQNGNERKITNKVTIDANNNLSSVINSIAPGTKIKITYKAKVNNNTANLGKTIKSQIQVGKVINNEELFEGSNTIEFTIGRTLTLKERDAIITTAKKYSNKTYNGKTRNLIDDIYADALNIDINLGDSTIKNMFNNIMYESGTTIKLASNNTTIRKMLLKNLYGYNLEQYDGVTSGTRYLDTYNLIAGDVIIYAYNDGTSDHYVMYLYLSETELLAVNSGKVVTRSNVQERLDSIIGSDKFAVLRPSLVI